MQILNYLMNCPIFSSRVFQVIFFAIGVDLFSLVSGQHSTRNPNVFSSPQKSIRGFYFKNYYDYVKDSYQPAPFDSQGKKTVILKAGKVTWSLELKVNKNLFSPKYQNYGKNFQPQASNLRDCHYHGKVTGHDQSFLAVSDCDGLHGMVVLNAYQKFTIHTLQHNRSIVLIRENSIHDGFGKYEKTTSMKLSKDFEGRQTGNKNGHAPLNQVNIKPGDGPMKLKNMTEGQKYLTTSTKDTKGFATPSTTKSMKMPTKTPIKTSTTKAPIVFTNQVPKENLKEETLKKKGNTKVKNNLPPSSKPFKSQEDLNYEEILKKRKRAVRQLWSSGQKIDFDKLGLGLDKVKRPTSNKNTGNIKTNLKKRQTGRNKYFELALTLGKIEEIEDPRHAEQYLADLVNLLQVYYIRHDFNGYSFRLSGTYYLEKHTELLGFSNLPAKNAYETFLERWKDFAEKLNFRSSDMKFFLPYRPNEKYDLIPDYGYSYINDDCSKEWAKGLAFITDLYITNLYEIAGTLTHELGHLSGMNHDGENSCNEAKFGKMMQNIGYDFQQWMDFSRCSLRAMKCFPSGNS